MWICPFDHDPVLIEASWNVKKYESTRIWVKKDGINRNIVECKVALSMLPAKAPAY